MKRFASVGIISATLLALTPLAYAANGNDVIVTNVGNERYVFGGNTSVNQPVGGDLTVAGGTVTINAPVRGSVQAAGGTVILGNTVQGNVRAAGGTVEIKNNINGNLVVAGGTVHIHSGAVIGGSVLVMAGELTLNGSVHGTLTVRGGSVALNGVTRADADIRSETLALNGRMLGNATIAAQTIAVGRNASISKDLHYWLAAGKQDYSPLVKGAATYDPVLAMKASPKGEKAGFFGALFAAVTLYGVFSAALIIGLFMFATKTFFRDSAKILGKKPGMSFLHGVLYFLLAPVVAMILLITVIGAPIALAVILTYVLSVFFAKILAAMVIARWAQTKYKMQWTEMHVFFVSLGIYILMKIMIFIPVIGWIAVALSVCAAFGALLQAKYVRYRKIM